MQSQANSEKKIVERDRVGLVTTTHLVSVRLVSVIVLWEFSENFQSVLSPSVWS